MEIRKPYDRVRQQITIPGESKTDTSHGNDTDVNRIVARFARTGELPSNPIEPQYADVTSLQCDLTETIERGKNASAELKQHQAQQVQEQQQKLTDDAAALAAYRAAEAAATTTPENEA